MCVLGDIDGMINSVKSIVRNVNDIINEVLDGFIFIQIDVERIKDIYGSIQSEDFNKVFGDVDNLGIGRFLVRIYQLFFLLLYVWINLICFLIV